jgi:hypothetical protein
MTNGASKFHAGLRFDPKALLSACQFTGKESRTVSGKSRPLAILECYHDRALRMLCFVGVPPFHKVSVNFDSIRKFLSSLASNREASIEKPSSQIKL